MEHSPDAVVPCMLAIAKLYVLFLIRYFPAALELLSSSWDVLIMIACAGELVFTNL